MQLPAIHLNGSDPLDLLKQYTDALTAVTAAVKVMGKIECHGRDYYTINSTAVYDANRWRSAAIKSLLKLGNELEAAMLHINNHPNTQKRLREESLK